MNRFLNGILLLLLPVVSMAESFDALTSEDAGQLLYDTATQDVLVYQHNAPGKRWQCNLFRSEKVRSVSPEYCIMLNGNVSQLDSRMIALELAYWEARGDKKRSNAYNLIAQKNNSTQTNTLLAFYSELADHCKFLYKDIREYNIAMEKVKREKPQESQKGVFGQPGRGCPFNPPFPSGPASQKNDNGKDTKLQLLEKSLKDALADTPLAKRLQAMSKDKDVFTLFCLYRSYALKTQQLIRRLKDFELQKELVEELEQQGEEILQHFLQMRSYNRNRENNFKTLCPGKHGSWEFAPPTSLFDMWERTVSCYKALEKIQTLSPHSEFPDWGNAMLEVLQMIKYQPWEEQFDKASSEYQKYNSN